MSAGAPAARAHAERDWWLRALAVLVSPRPVFAALRDDSEEAASAREEPVLALVLLAGVAGVLLTSSVGRFLDDPAIDGVLVAVLVFIAGALYGVATYWIGGAALLVGLRGAGGSGSYRRARHLLAYSAVPLVLTLVLVWPLRLAVYGGDVFRSGGGDEGVGGTAFDVVSALFVAWACALLVLGVATVERWRLLRGLVALALVVLALLALSLPFVIPLASS